MTFAQPSAANAAADSWRDVDDVDALLAAAVVDREQVAAGQREQLGDAVAGEAAGDQAAAVHSVVVVSVVIGAESTPRSGGRDPATAV